MAIDISADSKYLAVGGSTKDKEVARQTLLQENPMIAVYDLTISSFLWTKLLDIKTSDLTYVKVIKYAPMTLGFLVAVLDSDNNHPFTMVIIESDTGTIKKIWKYKNTGSTFLISKDCIEIDSLGNIFIVGLIDLEMKFIIFLYSDIFSSATAITPTLNTYLTRNGDYNRIHDIEIDTVRNYYFYLTTFKAGGGAMCSGLHFFKFETTLNAPTFVSFISFKLGSISPPSK